MYSKAETLVVPRMPPEVIDEILGHLAPDLDHGSLQSCALVSRSWAPSCQCRLFHTVTFSWLGMERWLKTFPAPEEGPACLVRNLGYQIGGRDRAPEEFFEYTPWFTNVERVALLSHRGKARPLWISWNWRFPQTATSLTSLTINADSIKVDTGVGWNGGSLLWIPTALSTFRPATSPHLSAVKLNLFRSPNVRPITRNLIEDAGNDLRWVVDEVARIDREFEGAVNITVLRDLKFQAASDGLNILHRHNS